MSRIAQEGDRQVNKSARQIAIISLAFLFLAANVLAIQQYNIVTRCSPLDSIGCFMIFLKRHLSLLLTTASAGATDKVTYNMGLSKFDVGANAGCISSIGTITTKAAAVNEQGISFDCSNFGRNEGVCDIESNNYVYLTCWSVPTPPQQCSVSASCSQWSGCAGSFGNGYQTRECTYYNASNVCGYTVRQTERQTCYVAPTEGSACSNMNNLQCGPSGSGWACTSSNKCCPESRPFWDSAQNKCIALATGGQPTPPPTPITSPVPSSKCGNNICDVGEDVANCKIDCEQPFIPSSFIPATCKLSNWRCTDATTIKADSQCPDFGTYTASCGNNEICSKDRCVLKNQSLGYCFLETCDENTAYSCENNQKKVKQVCKTSITGAQGLCSVTYSTAENKFVAQCLTGGCSEFKDSYTCPSNSCYWLPTEYSYSVGSPTIGICKSKDVCLADGTRVPESLYTEYLQDRPSINCCSAKVAKVTTDSTVSSIEYRCAAGEGGKKTCSELTERNSCVIREDCSWSEENKLCTKASGVGKVMDCEGVFNICNKEKGFGSCTIQYGSCQFQNLKAEFGGTVAIIILIVLVFATMTFIGAILK